MKIDSNDEFDRGFHGIPDQPKLSSMGYVELCARLQSVGKASPAFLVYEQEKALRDAESSKKDFKHKDPKPAPRSLV